MEEYLDIIKSIICDYVYGKIDAEEVKKRISTINFSQCSFYRAL